MSAAQLAVLAVVAARFLAPLAIPWYPLPGLFASIVLDSADEAALRFILGADLSNYQPYDKALDLYALSITMLAVLRNWENRSAVAVARTLFYVRLVGVLAFELTDRRYLLVLFANTFEYFVIAYEFVRAWWSPERLTWRWLVTVAGALWVVVKLPQEYALHVLGTGVSQVIREGWLHAPASDRWADLAAQLLSFVTVAALVALAMLAARLLGPPPQHPLRLAAGPLPDTIDAPAEWAEHVASHWRPLDRHAAEKVVLVGALSVTFAQLMPAVEASPAQIAVGVALLVALNSLWLQHRTRRRRSMAGSIASSFLRLLPLNLGLTVALLAVLPRRLLAASQPAMLLFPALLSLIVTLYDHWHPVFERRVAEPARPVAP